MNMKFFAMWLPEDLKNWAAQYVSQKGIKGKNNVPSVAELVRRLLKKERDKDKKEFCNEK